MLIILWYTLSAMLWLLPRWEPPEKPSLPVEIWMEILSYCDYDVLQRVKRLNKRFKVLVEVSSAFLNHSLAVLIALPTGFFARREALPHLDSRSSARGHARLSSPSPSTHSHPLPTSYRQPTPHNLHRKGQPPTALLAPPSRRAPRECHLPSLLFIHLDTRRADSFCTRDEQAWQPALGRRRRSSSRFDSPSLHATLGAGEVIVGLVE